LFIESLPEKGSFEQVRKPGIIDATSEESDVGINRVQTETVGVPVAFESMEIAVVDTGSEVPAMRNRRFREIPVEQPELQRAPSSLEVVKVGLKMRKQGTTEEVDPEHGEIRSSSCVEMPMKYGGNGLQKAVESGSDGNPVIPTDRENAEDVVVGSSRGKADSPRGPRYLEDVHGIGCRRICWRERAGCEERFLVKKFQGERKNEKRNEEDEEGNGEYGRGKEGSESSK
jgi:hypothetical protein